MNRGSRVSAVLVGAVLMSACSGSGPSGSSESTAASSTVSAVATSTSTAPSTTEGEGPVTPPALWALNRSGDILHLDPGSGEVLATTSFSDADPAYAAGAYVAGNLWLAIFESGGLTRVSTDDGSTLGFVPGGAVCCIVSDGDQLWDADTERAVVNQRDPSTGEVVKEVAVDEPQGRVVIGSDATFVVLDKSDKVVRVDDTGSITASAPVPEVNIYGAYTDGIVWVNDQQGVIALDATTLEEIRRVDGVFPFGMTGDGDVLWVADARDALTRIDASTGEASEWALITDPQQVVVAGELLYVLDKEGRIWLGSTLGPGLRAFPGTPKGISQLVYSPAHHADGSLATQPAVTTVPTTEPTTIPLPVGVIWHPVDLPSEAAISSAARVVDAGTGFVVIGRETQTDGGQPAIWTSADGVSFAHADTAALSPPGSHVLLADAATANGTTVAVGSRGISCDATVLPDFSFSCPRQAGVAWFTADGSLWQAGTATDGSFDEGLVTALDDVATFASGFVAVGHVFLDRTTWQIGVWTSADGQAWTRTAMIADPGGLLRRPAIALTGTTLVVSAQVTRCETPQDVFGGFGFVDPLRNGRGYTSTNAADWVPIDLVGAGLEQDQGPEACDPEAQGAGFVPSGVTDGAVYQVGDAAIWTGANGMLVSTDGATWNSVPAPPDHSAEKNTNLDGLFGRLAGTGINDLLSLVAGPVDDGEVSLFVAAFTEEGWDDFSDSAGGVPAFGVDVQVGSGGLRDILKTADQAVMVGTAADESGASPHAVAFVSEAGMIEVD